MDDKILQLALRNAELETELRLVKEQLTQANSGISYVVGRLGGSDYQSPSQAYARLKTLYEDALREVAELKAMLRDGHERARQTARRPKHLKQGDRYISSSHESLIDLSETEGEHFLIPDSKGAGEVDTSTSERADQSSSIPRPRHLVAAAHDVPLPSAEHTGDVESSVSTYQADPASPVPTLYHPVEIKPLSPGMPEHSRMVSMASLLATDLPEARYEKWKNMSKQYNHRPRPLEEYEEYWQSAIRPAHLRHEERRQRLEIKPLSPGMPEHSRMASMAIWLEDDSPATRFEKWRALSQQFNHRPRPLQEYEEYWQRRVRPAYLERGEQFRGRATTVENEKITTSDVDDNKDPEGPYKGSSPEGAVSVDEVATEEKYPDHAATDHLEPLLLAVDPVQQASSTTSDRDPQMSGSTLDARAIQDTMETSETKESNVIASDETRRDSAVDGPMGSTDTILMPITDLENETLAGSGVPGTSRGSQTGATCRLQTFIHAEKSAATKQSPITDLPVVEIEPVERVDATSISDHTKANGSEGGEAATDDAGEVSTTKTVDAQEAERGPENDDLPRYREGSKTMPASKTKEGHQCSSRKEAPGVYLEQVPPRRSEDHDNAPNPASAASCKATTPTGPRHHSDSLTLDCDTRRGGSRKPCDVTDLFFLPPPNALHLHLRTVLIHPIPATTDLFHVLRRVHGGRIATATLVNTRGFRNTPLMGGDGNGNTALITFADGCGARDFVRQSDEHPILFPSSSSSSSSYSDDAPPVQAAVELLRTPCRPLPGPIARELADRHLTRVFYMLFPSSSAQKPKPEPRQVRDALSHYVGVHPGRKPLRCHYDPDGVLCLEFASIHDARAACEAVRRNAGVFGFPAYGFLPDPCERRLGEKLDGKGEGETNGEDWKAGKAEIQGDGDGDLLGI